MNKCLNCNSEILDNRIYCDDICKYGFRTRMYREFNEQFKKVLHEE